jgi:hypothetical protein
MNQDAHSIQNHESMRKTQELKNIEPIGYTQTSVGKILKKWDKYTNKFQRNNTTYEIKINQNALDDSIRVLTCKLKVTWESKKEVTYTFEIGVDIGVSPSGKAGDSESPILGSNPSTPAMEFLKFNTLSLIGFESEL